MLVLLHAPIGAAQKRAATEAELKAAFVFNFARFVEWPGSALDRAEAFQICVAGSSAELDLLDQMTSDKVVTGRKVKVRSVRQNDPKLRECQILFIASGAPDPYLETVRGAPVLTVGNGTHFTEQGGTIDFITEQDAIRFEINLEAATRAQLKISSKLLALARIVRSNGQS